MRPLQCVVADRWVRLGGGGWGEYHEGLPNQCGWCLRAWQLLRRAFPSGSLIADSEGEDVRRDVSNAQRCVLRSPVKSALCALEKDRRCASLDRFLPKEHSQWRLPSHVSSWWPMTTPGEFVSCARFHRLSTPSQSNPRALKDLGKGHVQCYDCNFEF